MNYCLSCPIVVCGECIRTYCGDCVYEHKENSHAYSEYCDSDSGFTCIFCFVAVQSDTIRDFNMAEPDQIEWVSR